MVNRQAVHLRQSQDHNHKNRLTHTSIQEFPQNPKPTQT